MLSSAVRLRSCVRPAANPRAYMADNADPSHGVDQQPPQRQQQQQQQQQRWRSSNRTIGDAGAARARHSRPAPPDHFIALRVPLAAARQAGFESVHAALRPRFANAFVDVAAAHVTLGVLTLCVPPPVPPPTPADAADAPPPPPRMSAWGHWPILPPDPGRLASAVSALEEAAAALRPGGAMRLVLGPAVGQFGRGRVLWLGVGDDDGGGSGGGSEGGGGGAPAPTSRLHAAEAAVRTALASWRLAGAGGGASPRVSFTPHVTVAKARAWGRTRFIPPDAYAAAAAGVRAVPFTATSLQLCEMAGRPAGEYYRVVAEAEFG
jgi:2'-5' RNA ligase